MFLHHNLFGVDDVQSFSLGPDHTCNEFSGQDSDLSLCHSKAPPCIKEVPINLGMLWNVLTILSEEHYTLGQDLISPQTSQIIRHVSLSICKTEYHRILWKCLSWETFQLPESHSSPWKASGPNSQAPAVLPWHNDMIQKQNLPWDGGTNLAHSWELWSLSYALRTVPQLLEIKIQLWPSLWPKMGETIREAMGHPGATGWKTQIYKRSLGLTF